LSSEINLFENIWKVITSRVEKEVLSIKSRENLIALFSTAGKSSISSTVVGLRAYSNENLFSKFWKKDNSKDTGAVIVFYFSFIAAVRAPLV